MATVAAGTASSGILYYRLEAATYAEGGPMVVLK
jgi:hypothetical protein